MKNLLWLIFFSLILSVSFSACNNSTRTYAKELAAEKALIEDYVKRQGIRVVDKMPTDAEFLNDKKLYYKSTSGLYYRLEKQGRLDKDTIAPGKDVLKIDSRYIEYTLDSKSDTVDYKSPNRYPYGATFVYGSSSTSTASAFQEAVYYMRRTEAEAKLIVPSKLGFSTSVVTPYGYDLNIQFRKDTIPK